MKEKGGVLDVKGLGAFHMLGVHGNHAGERGVGLAFDFAFAWSTEGDVLGGYDALTERGV